MSGSRPASVPTVAGARCTRCRCSTWTRSPRGAEPSRPARRTTLYQSLLTGLPPAVTTWPPAAVTRRDPGAAHLARIDELPFQVVLAATVSEGGTATATEPGDPAEAVATTVGRPARFELRVVAGDGSDVPRARRGDPAAWRDHVLPSTTPRRPRRRCPPTAGCALGPAASTGTGAADRRPGEGHVHRRASRLPGGDRERAARTGIGQAAVVGVPDERLGEVGVFRRPTRRSSTLTRIAWSREHGQLQAPPPRSSTRLPLNATGQGRVRVAHRGAPGTWRSPAVPRSWSTSSCTWRNPEAPIGSPLAIRPPSVLTGIGPPISVSPSAISRSCSPS